MLIFKLIVGLVINMAIFGGLLFLPAGTWEWRRAWVFLGTVFVSYVAMAVYVFPGREDLLNERFKPPIQKGQPLADKVIVILFIVTFLGSIVFIPLDIFRLHLMDKPGTLVSFFGLVLFVAGWWIICFAFKENSFAAPVVKHQKQQTVADTGSLRLGATSDVRGRCPPSHRHAPVVGIVRSRFAGERSNRDARSADPGRRAVSQTRIEGLRRLYRESPVSPDPISLVSFAEWWRL